MNQPLQNHSVRKGIRLSLACCSAILLMMLSACGQSGPLFLPEDSRTESATTEQAADAGQKSDSEEEDGEGPGR